MKKSICLLMAVLLLAAVTACHKIQPADPSPANTAQPSPAETQDAGTATDVPAANTMTAYRADGATVVLEDCGDGTWLDADGLRYYLGEDGILRARGAEDLYTERPSAAATNTPAPTAPVERQDGERFEAVIMLEGMEETVRYEHVRNDSLGFEMDYDYESFVRHSEAVCDRFVSIWDDPEDPQNYLEVQYSAEDADTVAASVSESLSDDYEIIREAYTLDYAGSCLRIDASEVKGGGYTADQMQTVYIIPTDDGCRIATAHYSAESAEGLGRRISYMMNTFKVIDRSADFADSTNHEGQTGENSGGWTGADFGERTEEEISGWTGADFGERIDEDFGEWTGADFGERIDEDFDEWTGADFGERTEEEIGGWTGADFGERTDEDFGD